MIIPIKELGSPPRNAVKVAVGLDEYLVRKRYRTNVTHHLDDDFSDSDDVVNPIQPAVTDTSAVDYNEEREQGDAIAIESADFANMSADLTADELVLLFSTPKGPTAIDDCPTTDLIDLRDSDSDTEGATGGAGSSSTVEISILPTFEEPFTTADRASPEMATAPKYSESGKCFFINALTFRVG